jgi:hypothetical protein
VRFEVVPHLQHIPDVASYEFWLYGTLKMYHRNSFDMDEEVEVAIESGFKSSLKSSTAKGSKHLFSTGGIILNKREATWKDEYRSIVHILSYVFLFYFNTVSGNRDTNMEALLSEHLLYAGWKNMYVSAICWLSYKTNEVVQLLSCLASVF